MIFLQAGYDYDEETFEKVFRRIYSTFGSSAPYTIFPDSKPFLNWLRGKGVLVEIVSNAEYRYPDVILPALGLNKVYPVRSVFTNIICQIFLCTMQLKCILMVLFVLLKGISLSVYVVFIQHY